MKSIFIVYNQAYNMEVIDSLEKLSCRGFTTWQDVGGRGSVDGEPHLGSHAWPAMNNAILTIVDDNKVDSILKFIKEKDEETPMLGLRAFVWNIESVY